MTFVITWTDNIQTQTNRRALVYALEYVYVFVFVHISTISKNKISCQRLSFQNELTDPLPYKRKLLSPSTSNFLIGMIHRKEHRYKRDMKMLNFSVVFRIWEIVFDFDW